MKKELTESEFIDLFDKYNRSENFTIKARSLLYDHLIYDNNINIISICCSYNEMTFNEALDYFNIDYDEESELIETCVYNYLTKKTFVVGVTENSIIFEV
jgi:hypothetical protein